MSTPAAKLLERIVLLRDQTIPNIRINSLEESPEVVEEFVFRAIEETRGDFEAIRGFGRLHQDYRQAAEIHRSILQPILDAHPDFRRFITSPHFYYTG